MKLAEPELEEGCGDARIRDAREVIVVALDSQL